MKNFLIALLLFAIPATSFAQASGTSTRVVFSSTNIGISTWVPLITQTTRAIQSISVLNTGGYALKLGIAGAGAASNAEAQVAIIPASMSAPVVLPISFSGGYRISILAYTSVSTGEGQFNFFY